MRLKALTILFVATVAASLAMAGYPRLAQSEPLVYGDVDCSGVVDSLDALLILQIVAFQTWQHLSCPKNFDSDNNGALTASDALLVLQFHARLIQRLGPSDETIPAVALALGDKHSCALTAPGGLKCWGDNSSGQLGDGTTWSRRIPVDTAAPSQNFVAVTAGSEHTCALTDIGGVKCWGRNDLGQLGNGISTGPQLCFDPGRPGQDYACSRTPVDVKGLASGVTLIAAGANHTCAVLADGQVKCWGLAQLAGETSELCGRSNYPCSTVPLDVGTFGEGVTEIEAGFSHTCILTTAGAVKCWGANSDGQLGDGTTTDIHTPVEVKGLTDKVAALALGETHTCALTVGGAVECWGGNAAGQVGTPLTACVPLPACRIMAPVVVTGLSSGVLAIAADVRHNCVLTANGGAKCWGESGFGVLGAEGNETCFYPCSSTPLDVTGLGSGPVQLAAGRLHNCVIVNGGSVQCWGFNFYEQLGVKTTYKESQCFCSQAPVSIFGFGRAP